MAVVDWQQSLFGFDAPAPDGTFAGLRRIELAGGAWIDHVQGWMAGHDTLMAQLVDGAPWRQRTRHLYGQVVDEPRLTAWWGAKEGDLELPGAVIKARRVLSERYAVDFDSVGCNLYRDGRDSVAWHGDTVRKLMAEPLVAIVSLGEPRRLLLRPRGGGSSMRFALGAGDLLVMAAPASTPRDGRRTTWAFCCDRAASKSQELPSCSAPIPNEHCVPKVRRAGPRMSVTFRHSQPAAA